MKNIILLFTLFIVGFSIHGQEVEGKYLTIPQERIYLHQNTTFALSGEYLLYNVYCLFDKQQHLSKFSKIAYVELVGNNHEVIFKHKIRLNNGIGQGDFFIPTSISTGNYKVIAYTQWMKNGPVSNFYQNDILIINPFQSNQVSNNTLTNIPEPFNEKSTEVSPKKEDVLAIKLKQDSYNTRNQVRIEFDNLQEANFGNYSLSVRKIEAINSPKRLTAVEFSGLQNVTSTKVDQTSNLHQIPEIRGEILSGIIRKKVSNETANNIKVALSIPGKNYVFKIANTNSKGVFHFNLDAPYEGKDAVIQIINDPNEEYSIEIQKSLPIDYNELVFHSYPIDETNKEIILQRSINNQIENAYSNVKVDSILPVFNTKSFYNIPTHEYLLDDYTRFSTIRETILEVIEQATTKTKNNKSRIQVRIYDNKMESGLSLLLIDGLYIENHQQIIDAKASKIKKISLVNEYYIYGSQIFSGIMIMESYDGDFLTSNAINLPPSTKLFGPQDSKVYFNQGYDTTDKQERIPDFRHQLLWDPKVILNENNNSLSFFTSDLKGTFEIVLEGISQSGEFISLNKTFEVH